MARKKKKFLLVDLRKINKLTKEEEEECRIKRFKEAIFLGSASHTALELTNNRDMYVRYIKECSIVIVNNNINFRRKVNSDAELEAAISDLRTLELKK